MSKFSVSMLLFTLFLVQGLQQRNYTELYDAYCTPEFQKLFNLTDEERKDLRAGQKGIYFNATQIFDVVQERKVGSVIKEGAVIVLMIILTIFCLISFIVFICYCCCCDRANNSTFYKSKIYTFISFVFIVTFIALFIALLVFLGKLNTQQKNTNCGIASIPYELVKGVLAPEFNFLGFEKLSELLSSFSNEIQGLNQVTTDFSNIQNQNLPSSTKAALDSLPIFANKYTSATTSDGTGIKSRPISIQTLTVNINDAIFQEFSIYDQVATSLNDAAITGQQYTTNGGTVTAQGQINDVNNKIKSIKNEIDSKFGDVTTGVDYFNQYAPIGYWITLALGLVVAILGVLAILCVINMIRKSTDKCRMGVKFCLSFNGVFIFLLGIVAIVLLIASMSLGSMCSALGSLLNSPNISAEIAKYNLTLTTEMSDILNQCIPMGAKGDLSALIPSNTTSSFQQSQTFLDGLKQYQELIGNLTANGGKSLSINVTTNIWSNFQTSYWADQPTATVALSQFNDLIDCGGISYQLNAKNCTENTCKGIYDTDSFTPPSCGNAPSSVSNWNNLKAFTNDESSLLTNMISDLSGSQASTPLSLFQTSSAKMIAIISSFQNIENRLKNTLNFINKFQNGLTSNLNCTVLRRQLNNVEATFCFNFNHNLYYFAALLTWIVFFFLFFSWCLCCALRYMPNASGNVYDDKPRDATYYVNDDEQVPVY